MLEIYHTEALASSENLLEMQIPGPHLRPIYTEALRVGLSDIFTSPLGDTDAGSSLRIADK